MFQNISSVELDEDIEYRSENKKGIIKQILLELFTKQNIALYITTFMASTVSLRKSNSSIWFEYICCSL